MTHWTSEKDKRICCPSPKPPLFPSNPAGTEDACQCDRLPPHPVWVCLPGWHHAGWFAWNRTPSCGQSALSLSLPSDRTRQGKLSPRQRALVSMETGDWSEVASPARIQYLWIHPPELGWSQALSASCSSEFIMPTEVDSAPGDCLPLCSEHEFRGLSMAQKEPDLESDEARET